MSWDRLVLVLLWLHMSVNSFSVMSDEAATYLVEWILTKTNMHAKKERKKSINDNKLANLCSITLVTSWTVSQGRPLQIFPFDFTSELFEIL